MNTQQLAAQIDALLPQTQCTKCGYEGCRPYAQAIAAGAADFNQCPPGGEVGIVKLATLLGRAPKPLNPDNGIEQPRHIAFIDEARCIGCTLCIQACPVDAIVGAAKLMHTVVRSLCTGCDLCVAPCPVDCIIMQPAFGDDAIWDQPQADAARERHFNRKERLERLERERVERLARNAATRRNAPDADAKRALIEAAVERARARRAAQ
ncbi:MAG TPA: electron transport complex subunit RsxB [Burkholderiales bacterium]|nr:electron transport complex subunit RsxB [Burkholderiales bacterium]